MAEAAATGQATSKKQPRRTGVPEMDAAFDRIRADRKAARDNLKQLRKEFKKDCSTGTKIRMYTHAVLVLNVRDNRERVSPCFAYPPPGRCPPPPFEEEAAELVRGGCQAHRSDDGFEGRGIVSQFLERS